MDSFLFSLINSLSISETGQSVAVVLAQVLVWGMVLIACAVLLMKRTVYPLNQRVMYAVICILSTLALVYFIKTFFPRERPFVHEQAFVAIDEPNSVGSFPSSHAAVAMAIAVSVLVVYPQSFKQFKVSFVVLAVAVGFGRVMAGVHYPSDVFIGFVIGGLIPAIVSKTKILN